MNKHYFSIIFIGLLILGCLSPKPQSNTPISNFNTESPSLPSLTPTSNVTISPTVLPESNLIIDCAKISEKKPKINDFPIISTNENPKQIFSWNSLENKTLVKDAENIFIDFFTSSPDGKWLAYIQGDLDNGKKSLLILSNNGEICKNIQVDLTKAPSYWLNNSQLLLSHWGNKEGTQFVLNPFTGEEIELSINITDFHIDAYRMMSWEHAIIYSPNLKQAVYLGSPADIVLINTDSFSEIKRISPSPVSEAVPEWHPNGKEFVIAYADIFINWKIELYRINSEGEMKQLTNLSNHYKDSRFQGYKWSPNGRYLAFWLETMPIENPGIFEFGILDTNTGMVKNSCIQGVTRGYPRFFWSPNSDYLLIGRYLGNEVLIPNVILFNIKENSVTDIGNNLFPIGWFSSK